MESAVWGAVGALSVLLLERYFEYRSSQTAALDGKLEEFYEAVERLRKSARYPPETEKLSAADRKIMWVEKQFVVADNIIQARMLCKFHFPCLELEFEDIMRQGSAFMLKIQEIDSEGYPKDMVGAAARSKNITEKCRSFQERMLDERPCLTHRLFRRSIGFIFD